MLPEEKAREKIDKQLRSAGWNIVSRNEYVLGCASAVKEALMQGNKESDYLLFVDDKAIAVLEAKREENPLAEDVERQAEQYATHPQDWYGLWEQGFIPLVYIANGRKLYYKDMRKPDSDYVELKEMHSPKKMLQIIGAKSQFGALPHLVKDGLRDCQYEAEINLENSLKRGERRALTVLATGAGKTYLACLAAYRMLNYTPVKRVLFLVDRNNLGRQAANEFNKFQRTEGGQRFSELYSVSRLKHNEDCQATVVISTIQKLFAVLTGQNLAEVNEDEEDEIIENSREKDASDEVVLTKDLRLPPDYFQMIVVDECHRSIYGKWQAVLRYFDKAIVMGLTATPTEEAYAFFNKNVIENYSYDESVSDGVNVPFRVYRITDYNSVHGGKISKDSFVAETTNRTRKTRQVKLSEDVEYAPNEADRSVIDQNSIETVLIRFRDAIYQDLYPERKPEWKYIPKTLIFAKSDKHADEIVQAVKRIFAEKFAEGQVPDKFVQKITYTAGDSDALIVDLRSDKNFRIAVTVTLVATGTDVKPLEIVLFMRDVGTQVLYTQMKGRGCRSLLDAEINEVTPNAQTKECFYIVDAVGVTESEKYLATPRRTSEHKNLSLEHLLEHLAHNELSDENLRLLWDYLASIHRRYEFARIYGKYLLSFINTYNFSPRELATKISNAFESGSLPPFEDVTLPNKERYALISCLMDNVSAREELLRLKAGYYMVARGEEDKILYSGFSKESAQSFIAAFEKCLIDHKDQIEALRLIYNSEYDVPNHGMLEDLQEQLLTYNREYKPATIWQNYKTLDEKAVVDKVDYTYNVNSLTNLLQVVRFAYGKNIALYSLRKGYAKQFSLYCGQAQRTLSDSQRQVMQQIGDFIVDEGSFSAKDLNTFDPDLWRRALKEMGTVPMLENEMQTLAKFILRVA